MNHNISAIPAKVENSFVAQPLEQGNAAKQNDNLIEQTSKSEQDKKSIVQKSQSIEVKEEISNTEVEEAIEVVSSFINSTLKQVAFSRDNNAGKMVITMIDKETNEVINQFPSEKIISMAERIKELHQEVENISGLIIDSHV
ncbi:MULTISPECIES: flagellar protein FlaG [unclassified Colwellia]|uniref:flagellar protein FlaG n=1 Tax=unclassified Colwellia TaxID=196834 RepID=UPI0015F515DA|nr:MULTISPECIES: flagellar protein FlaG [unclassified Colwellia]MBA6253860.1 flagellar protein FlaG [Colwellia sp. MB3u-55]MBA6396429.1 flagellar protein FlaG [Colwellia sp. BRX10-4]